ncbi:MAG: IS110 family transposase [Chitinivibrionales bacterium]|nr:IS110 family transposase [Chitinivibrionales bacterium]
MSHQSKTVRFDKQEFHLGIDTHKSNWKVTIRTNDLHLKTFSMNPSPKELSTYMNRNYPGGIYYSVYEAGFCGYWIHRELTSLGFKNIVTNPADVPTSNKEKDRKSDVIDSGKLSREHEKHSLTGIYVPTPSQESLRSLSRLWQQNTKKSIQVKCRIKGFLSFTGVKIPGNIDGAHWPKNYLRMLARLSFTEQDNKFILEKHLEDLEDNRRRRLLLIRRIREISKENTTITFLRTVPGIGLIVGFILYAELLDIRRFKGLDDLLSYIGLVPSASSSGGKETIRGMTQRQNRHLRYILIESAWVAVRKDPALTACYNDLSKRMLKQRVIIRIAKKLTNRIRYVWLHQKPYVPAVVE